MINFETEIKGTWFYFDDDDQDAGGISFRELSVDENERIEKITTSSKPKFSHGQRFLDKKTDDKLAAKMRWDYCIVDWKGVQIDGVDVECNVENKARLVRTIGFVKFATPCLNELTETNQAFEEDRVKNSESSSDEN